MSIFQGSDPKLGVLRCNVKTSDGPQSSLKCPISVPGGVLTGVGSIVDVRVLPVSGGYGDCLT